MIASARRLRAERKAFLDAYKRMLGCMDCGTIEGRLDFDHRNKAEKSFKVGSNVSLSWRRLVAEIAKCDVRCAPCHARRHHVEEPGARAGRGIPKPRRRRSRVGGGDGEVVPVASGSYGLTPGAATPEAPALSLVRGER